MSEAKIRLSEKELDLLSDSDLILTKNAILEKTTFLLSDLQTRQKEYLSNTQNTLLQTVKEHSPKISKGENYKGLPYLVLDYPRDFSQSGIFAIRTFFWWGNFFSVTLHISGRYKKELEAILIKNGKKISELDFYCCVNPTEWEHDFESSNYMLVKEKSTADWQKMVSNNSFIKVAKKIPARDWNNSTDQLFTFFKEIIDWLEV